MTEKKVKDRQVQNEFLAKIQQCISKYDEADQMFEEIDDFIANTMPTEQSKYNKMQQDYLHLIENYELSDAQILTLSRRLEENRNDRRNWDNIARIALVWKNNKSKILYKNQRPFLRNQISKEVKNLDNDWVFRVLSEEEIKKYFDTADVKVNNTKQIKRGRPSTPQTVVDSIVHFYRQGLIVNEICDKVNVKKTTVYKIIKQYKQGESNEHLSNS